MKTAVLICWMACSGPGALAGDGGHDQNVPVEVGLRSMEISCRESGGEDEQALPAVKLSFALNFGVFEPFDLNGNGHVGDQSLEAEDSTGRNLGAVTFDVGNLHTWKRGKRKGTVFKGGNARNFRLRRPNGYGCTARSAFPWRVMSQVPFMIFPLVKGRPRSP